MQTEAKVEVPDTGSVDVFHQLFHDEHIEGLLAEATGTKYRSHIPLFTVLFASLIGVGVTLLLIDEMIFSDTGPNSNIGLTLFLLGSFAVAVTALFDRWETQDRVLERIARHSNVASAGPLLETLNWHDRPVKQAITRALIRILPNLHSSEAHRITRQVSPDSGQS